MISFDLYIAFIATAICTISMPGPSVLFIISRSVNKGFRKTLFSIFGLSIGAFCHAVAVALGLAQILTAYPQLFTIVKNLGCLYLIYLGIKTVLSKNSASTSTGKTDSSNRESPAMLLKEGIIVELLNPKTAIFFLAFLPQFTNESAGNTGLQLFLLGLTFILLILCNDTIYALTASHIGNRLKRSAGFSRIEKYLSGGIYCSLGIFGLFYRISRK